MSEDAARIIKSTAKRDVDRHLQTMTAAVVTLRAGRFKMKEGNPIKQNFTIT